MIIPHSKPTLDSSDIRAVSKVLKSGKIAQGQTVRQFEKKLAGFIGTHDAVATSSGTSAIHLSLLALNIKRGDEVILPSYVCLAPLIAINHTGAKPKFCDISPTDFNISAKEVKKKINKNTKAIIVPHMFGMPADIDKFLRLDVPIIEDCAHSIGATFKGKKVGKFGTISIFSFYATKMLTCGEGGMVCSNSATLLKKIRDMREYDKKDKLMTYFNCKMSDIQAALGLNQLLKLRFFVAKRKKIASEFNVRFTKCNVELPTSNQNKENVFYRYIIKTDKNLNKVIIDLEKKGIICRRPVFKPLHRYLKLKEFPNTDAAWDFCLSIPLYPSLSKTKIKKIEEVITAYFGRKE